MTRDCRSHHDSGYQGIGLRQACPDNRTSPASEDGETSRSQARNLQTLDPALHLRSKSTPAAPHTRAYLQFQGVPERLSCLYGVNIYSVGAREKFAGEDYSCHGGRTA